MTAAFFEATRAAEEARVDETARCVRLQSAWRRVVCVAFFNEQQRTIRLMQRHLRGWLGRQKARRARRARDIGRQRAVFDAIATTIQRRFRAYHSRKYRHSFYARQVRAPRSTSPPADADAPSASVAPSCRPPPDLTRASRPRRMCPPCGTRARRWCARSASSTRRR